MPDSWSSATTVAQRRLRARIILIASVPLLLAIAAVALMAGSEFTTMEGNVIKAVDAVMLQARKDELQHFVQAGSKVMSEFCVKDKTQPGSREEGRNLLHKMDFGDKTDDNYFFLYMLDGTNVMHPRIAALEGQRLMDFQDSAGTFVIKELLEHAKTQNDRFFSYLWHRPSTGHEERKLAYVEIVPGCDLMIGTGLYLDHLQEARDGITLQAQEATSSTRRRIVVIALASLVLVAAGGLTLNLQTDRKLQDAHEELRALRQLLETAREAERTRICRDLHDSVMRELPAVKCTFEIAQLHLLSGDSTSASTLLDEGVDQLINVTEDVDRITHDLRCPLLDDIGLGAALSELGRRFGEQAGAPFVDVRGVDLEIDKGLRFGDDIEINLYRVAQAALRNIEKHAQAENVEITLNHEAGGLRMLIRDDGVGFNPRESRGGVRGLGLVHMRERVEKTLRGEFTIESHPGAGTLLTAFVPGVAGQDDSH